MKRTIPVLRLPTVCCLTACFGVLALLASPALAQINGSGTSPSSAFDFVLNLPEDQTEFNGDIGGLRDQTLQLNVFDGGIVDSSFIGFGVEMNISGGAVGSGLMAFSESEVNISAGSLGNRFTANSELSAVALSSLLEPMSSCLAVRFVSMEPISMAVPSPSVLQMFSLAHSPMVRLS